MWYIDQNTKYGADIILPPAPLVDGTNTKMLDIVASINQIAKEIVFEETDAFHSFYLPIHPDAFKEEIRCRRIMKMIKENITMNNLLILKFFRTRTVLNESTSRARLGRFLSSLDQLKKSFNEMLAIMTLDSKSEGLAMMGNGIDLTCDPLGGVNDEVQFKRKKKKGVDTGDVDESQPKKFQQHGKYLHPGLREFISISDLIDGIEPDGVLPHDCDFCNKMHHRLTDKTGATFPKRNEWNAGRRLHNYICRKEEDEWLLNAIDQGNLKATELYLSRRERADKNLVDLLP